MLSVVFLRNIGSNVLMRVSGIELRRIMKGLWKLLNCVESIRKISISVRLNVVYKVLFLRWSWCDWLL